MRLFPKTDEEKGKMFAGMTRFAVGASGHGAPQSFTTAAEGPHGKRKFRMGERLARGIRAVQADSLGDLYKDEQDIELSKSKQELTAQQAKELTIKNENLQRPYKYKELLMDVDPTGVLSGNMEKYFSARGIDKDGNGTVTEEEFQEGLREDSIRWVEMIKFVQDTSAGTEESLRGVQEDVNTKLAALTAKNGNGKTWARQDFKNKDIANLYPAVAKAIEAETTTKALYDKQVDAVKTAQMTSLQSRSMKETEWKGLHLEKIMQRYRAAGFSTDMSYNKAFAEATGKGTPRSYFMRVLNFDLLNASADDIREVIKEDTMAAALRVVGPMDDIHARSRAKGVLDRIIRNAEINDRRKAVEEMQKATGMILEGQDSVSSHATPEELAANMADLKKGISDEDREYQMRYLGY